MDLKAIYYSWKNVLLPKNSSMIRKLILVAVCTLPYLFKAQESIPTTNSKIAILPSIGYAWRLSKVSKNIPENSQQYFKDLNKGINIGIGAYYLLDKKNAIGIRYSSFLAQSEGTITNLNATEPYISEQLNTKESINFVGASYMHSNFSSPTKHKLFYDISLGIAKYSSKTNDQKISASSLAGEVNFGYQYSLNKHFLLGPKIGLAGGTLRKAQYNNTTINNSYIIYDGTLNDHTEEEKKVGFTRLSLSAAVTFRF
jgi:hypothetical protein